MIRQTYIDIFIDSTRIVCSRSFGCMFSYFNVAIEAHSPVSQQLIFDQYP